MLIQNILLGFLGLGLLVFVHELGHMVAARLMKIDVEAFSIGWGKPILRKKIGAVEYRLGLFPIGGYCKMRGDGEYEEIYEKRKQGIPPAEGSYFAAHPFRRITACLGGPLFNLFFAVLIFAVVWGIGFEVNTLSNRVILVSDIIAGSHNPADDAGLQTGDRIVSINGRTTETSSDIQQNIVMSADRLLSMQVERDGEIIDLYITPRMSSTGAGLIGIYFWTDPIIQTIIEGGPAEIAGLLPGDEILTVNGIELSHTMDFLNIFEERPLVLNIEHLRNGQVLTAQLIPIYSEEGAVNLGIAWQTIRFQTPRLSLPMALVTGASEAWRTLTRSVASLSLLFRGVDLTQAVSGPGRITYMIGEVAVDGFNHSFAAGLRSLASFLALISIALCIMNLLPLPVLDGGMILLYIAEFFRGKLPHPKFLAAFQTVGVVLIAGLMIFALMGDILFFTSR